MLFVTLFSKYFCLTFCSTANLLTVTADRIAIVLKTSCTTQEVVLDILKTFYKAWHTSLLSKFRVYGIMNKCFILFSYIVVAEKFELYCSTNHLLSESLTDYLRVSLYRKVELIAMNKLRKV